MAAETTTEIRSDAYNCGLHHCGMTTLGRRIALKREQARLSQSELARRLKLSPQAVQKWESEVSVPRGRRLDEIASALSTTVGYLVTGDSPSRNVPVQSNAEIISYGIDEWDDDTPLDDEEIELPFLKEVELSAGSGKTAVQVSGTRKLRFGKYTVRSMGVQPENAVCVRVSGNSMEPVLQDGGTVAVDTAKNRVSEVVDGKMYAINHSGQVRVKQVFRLARGGLKLRSFNREDHPDEEYSAEQLAEEEIVLIGRVFWGASFF